MRISTLLVLLAVAAGAGCNSDIDPVNRCVPMPLRPEPDAVLDNGCLDFSDEIVWEFAWTACDRATAYHLFAARDGAPLPVIDLDTIEGTTFTFEGGGYVAEPNRTGWSWRVRSRTSAGWGPWSDPRSFEVEPADTDCP